VTDSIGSIDRVSDFLLAFHSMAWLKYVL